MSFCGVPRRRLPLAGSFVEPAGLSGMPLVQVIASFAREPTPSKQLLLLQRRNCRSLRRKIGVLLCLAQSVAMDSGGGALPRPAELCFKELYIAVQRAGALLGYCAEAGRLWLLLQTQRISGHFHDLDQEIATLLDVLLPLRELALPAELREQLQLMRQQCSRSKARSDPRDEKLRRSLLSLLYGFEIGAEPPGRAEIREVFVDGLGIRSAADCRAEIEFMEELLYSLEEDVDPYVAAGVIALIRYSRFLLFGLREDLPEKEKGASFDDSELPAAVPKDFLCPISLDLMRDPVIASSGQTYERESIVRWMEGNRTCPNSGQQLMHSRLVPNRTLRSLISQWCTANGVPYASPDGDDGLSEAAGAAGNPFFCNSAVGANRATARILVRYLLIGREKSKAVAARQLRLLAKTGMANRAAIAEAGAIPLLHPLLRSSNPAAQENSVTAILNLSIREKNKALIMDEEGCLASIVEVLKRGWTAEARENAAAALFSLSAVHDYKKRIADDDSGAVEALVGLLMEGSSRGRKDAVMSLFNLSAHPETGERMAEGGAVAALVRALWMDEVAEEAAGALALLARQPVVAAEMGRGDAGVSGLVRLMRRGGPQGKENAAAALSEICRNGGASLTRRVASTPALGGLIQMLLFTGTKRARRKAASLARMCQRCLAEAAAARLAADGWGDERHQRQQQGRNSLTGRTSNVAAGDVAVSASMGISVQVL